MLEEAFSPNTTVTISMAVIAGGAIMAWGITLALVKMQANDNTKRLNAKDDKDAKWLEDYRGFKSETEKWIEVREDRDSRPVKIVHKQKSEPHK